MSVTFFDAVSPITITRASVLSCSRTIVPSLCLSLSSFVLAFGPLFLFSWSLIFLLFPFGSVSGLFPLRSFLCLLFSFLVLPPPSFSSFSWSSLRSLFLSFSLSLRLFFGSLFLFSWSPFFLLRSCLRSSLSLLLVFLFPSSSFSRSLGLFFLLRSFLCLLFSFLGLPFSSFVLAFGFFFSSLGLSFSSFVLAFGPLFPFSWFSFFLLRLFSVSWSPLFLLRSCLRSSFSLHLVSLFPSSFLPLVLFFSSHVFSFSFFALFSASFLFSWSPFFLLRPRLSLLLVSLFLPSSSHSASSSPLLTPLFPRLSISLFLHSSSFSPSCPPVDLLYSSLVLFFLFRPPLGLLSSFSLSLLRPFILPSRPSFFSSFHPLPDLFLLLSPFPFPPPPSFVLVYPQTRIVHFQLTPPLPSLTPSPFSTLSHDTHLHPPSYPPPPRHSIIQQTLFLRAYKVAREPLHK
ncbi:hypothetical protein C7M84_013051 [Penaeus vannamei]|uniref:Uncharacterized protein n=1 Tax=Penaeus vannamei TaxID=6689 RepID=A0A423SXD5_PENVA|nr:hypothetical protein C7M84_013051 [Penaeus vannamei]